MKLRAKMLLVFAATVAAGMVILYFLSRNLLLSSFRQLEVEQMKQNVDYALNGLSQEYSALARTTNDYAYWDRTYNFMLSRQPDDDFANEFVDASMDGLGLNLILIRDMEGKTAYAKAYDTEKHTEVPVPTDFLQRVFLWSQLKPSSIARAPCDGLLAFPDGVYLVSFRPILNSRREGEPQGVFLAARKFDESGAIRITDLTRTSIQFQRVNANTLPPDFQGAAAALALDPAETYVHTINEDTIGGYALIKDLFGDPLLVLRVDTRRPIYERGKLSQFYLFATVFAGAVLSSLVILFFLQKFVLSPLGGLSRDVRNIGKRKAIAQRVHLRGRDELSSLAESINGMLAELERSQKQFLFLTENIHQVFWVKDTHANRYVYISSAFERITGRPAASVLQNAFSWLELVHAEDRPIVNRMLATQGLGRPTEAYYRIRSGDGTIRWLWERSFPRFRPDGSYEQTAGLTEDITEFKRNEEALLSAQIELEQRVADRTARLAERGELIKLLVDSIPVAMYGMDADGKLTFCNPAALAILGFKEEEVLGRNSHALFHHSHSDGSPYPVESCPVYACFLHGRDASVDDDVFWRKDGSALRVGYHSRQIRRDGRVVGVVVSFADITERKRQELELRHRQKLEAVGRLAAGIAHEINTPIQFIGDNTRFLQSSFRDERQLIQKYQLLCEALAKGEVRPQQLLQDLSAAREHADWDFLEKEIPRALDQMLDGLGRVATIVRGMKEFSHVDRHDDMVPCDLNQALESTLIVARNEIKYVADVQADFGEIPPVTCYLGDLNQVFLNLLVNAAHAIEEVVGSTGAKGEINVSTRREGDFVEIRIADTGPGIPRENWDKIFDPFFTTKKVGKGTGQGLALARTIVVEKHHGTLTFATRFGHGTTFFIRLPLAGAPVHEEALTK